MEAPTYLLVDNGRAIKCRICQQVSWSPADIAQKYCGYCHRFHDEQVHTGVPDYQS